MALATLSIDLEAKLANLERDFSKASRLAEQNAQKMKASYAEVNQTFETLGATLASAVGVNFAVTLIQNAIDAQDKLKDLSKSTSLTVETLAGLSSMANKTGGDIEGIADSINKLAVNMGKDSEKFAKLGIDAKDPLEAFKQLAEVFNSIEDPQKRAAFAAEALGKSWKSSAPALSEGSEAIAKMVERGQTLSKITSESADRADEFNDNLTDLKSAAGGLATEFANSLVPSLTDTVKAMTDSIEKGNTLEAVLRGIAGIGKIPWDAMLGSVDMSASNQLKELSDQLLVLQGQRETVDKGGLLDKILYGSTSELDQKIIVTRNQLEALQKFGDKISPKPVEKSGQAAPNEKDLSEFIGGASKKTDKHANDYTNLIQSLNEKVSVQTADLNRIEKLTAAEKDYAKYQADLASGALVLTASQKSVAEAFWSVYQARTKANETDKANEKATALVGDYVRGNALIVERIEREQELALMTERQRSIAEAVYRAEDEGSAIRERIIRDIQDETAQKIALAKAEEELAAQKEKVAEVTARSYDQQQSFSFGWNKAFQAYSDSANNAAKQAGDVFAQASQTMEDALVNFAMTGKISFSSLANSIIADIVRMQSKAAVSGLMGMVSNMFPSAANAYGAGAQQAPAPVVNAVPSANGNVFSSPSLSQYSNQIVSKPTFFAFAAGSGLMGEAGPEAIMPLKRGKDGKLGVSTDGGGVVVNVINNAGAETSTKKRSDGQGGSIIDVFIEQAKNAIAGDISSGNGSVPAAMSGAYGLKRTAGAY